MEDPKMVKVSKSKAVEMQWKLIYDWPNKSDTWAFKHGLGLLSASVSASAFYVASFYKRKLKLGRLGNLSIVMPCVLLPPFVLPIFQPKVVSEPILLQTECPVCIQFRSIMVQNLIGLGYPLLMAPSIGLTIANSYATIRVPEISFKNFPALYDYIVNISKRIKTPLLVLFALHSALAVFIANQQAYGLYRILDQLDSRVKNN